jgi:hypothetical protein
LVRTPGQVGKEEGQTMTARTSWWVATLSLVLLPGALWAQEGIWRPATVRPATSSAAAPSASVATLDRPVALDTPIGNASFEEPSANPAMPLSSLYRTAYQGNAEESGADPLPFIARGQPPDGVPPPVPGPPPPPPVGGYNQGVVTDQPLRKGWWDKCKDFFTQSEHASSGHCCFQSDHAFDCLISPLSDPFLFEDPRALTELRPIFIYQGVPSHAGGGYAGFFGTQARVAFTERWSLVVNELGWVYLHPSHPPPGVTDSTGFAQLSIGPKWTFYRNPDMGTVVATGLNFQIPTGEAKVFQDTGNLSLMPYLSAAQHLRLPQGFGGINLVGTTGFSFSVDSERSEYYYLAAHIDYDIAGLNKIFPLLELNWYHYTTGGRGLPLGFEGADLVNFGSSSLGRRDFVTLTPGIRYKFSECIQAGFGVDFPLTSQKELTNYRLTFDLIFRY